MPAMEQRGIKTRSEKPSTYKLDDGTTLTVKPTVIDVKRAKDQWGIDGKPVYVLTIANITETTSPPRLMNPSMPKYGAARAAARKGKK